MGRQRGHICHAKDIQLSRLYPFSARWRWNSRRVKSVEEACREAQVAPHTYYNWRKKYGGMKVDEAKRLKELEKENARLKHLVADLTLDKHMLQEVLKGNF